MRVTDKLYITRKLFTWRLQWYQNINHSPHTIRYYSQENRQTQVRVRQEWTEGWRPLSSWIYLKFKLSPSLFLCFLKAPKICVNSILTLTLIQTLVNLHTFGVRRNMVLRNKDGFLLAIMHYVCGEWLISWYHCNLQVINCRMIHNLLTLLVFIWLRCETALAPMLSQSLSHLKFNLKIIPSTNQLWSLNLHLKSAERETFWSIFCLALGKKYKIVHVQSIFFFDFGIILKPKPKWHAINKLDLVSARKFLARTRNNWN